MVKEVRDRVNRAHKRVHKRVENHRNRIVWSSTILVAISVIAFGLELLGVATVMGVLGALGLGLADEGDIL